MTNKLKYFIGNWKMFGDFADFKIVQKLNMFSKNTKKKLGNHKIILCLPSTLIYDFNKQMKSKFIKLGAQNCHYQQGYGPHTGSISALMLKKAGAKYIILGHSENRLEGETDSLIGKKINLALDQNLKVIFCVGEKSSERKQKKTFSVLKKQLNQSLNKLSRNNNIIIAYEPFWSIGTNKIPKRSEITKNIKFIKKCAKKIYKNRLTPKVLYGGSVNDKNIHLFSSIPDIDGFLIGGASQSSKKFIDIVKNYYK